MISGSCGSGWAGNLLESGEVQANANSGAIFPGDVRSSGDGLPRDHGDRKFPRR